MKKITKLTLRDLASQLLLIKKIIKAENKSNNNVQHSLFCRQQNDLVQQYNYYRYVREMEKFYASYIYRLKKLRGKHEGK